MFVRKRLVWHVMNMLLILSGYRRVLVSFSMIESPVILFRVYHIKDTPAKYNSREKRGIEWHYGSVRALALSGHGIEARWSRLCSYALCWS